MIRKVILDANLLIVALDDTQQKEPTEDEKDKKAEAKEKISQLMNDPTVILTITPLIRYEVLRGITWHDQHQFERVKNILNGFTEIDISQETSDLSSHLFRFDGTKNPTRNIDKRRFDVFHFATAKCEQLEFISEDTGMKTLENLYTDMINTGEVKPC